MHAFRTDPPDRTARRTAAPDRITLVAMAVAAGTAAGCGLPGALAAAAFMPAAGAGAALVLGSLITAARRADIALILLVLAAAPLAAAWSILRLSHEPDPRIATLSAHAAPHVLLTLEGRIVRAPRPHQPATDRLAPPWHRQASWTLELRAHSMTDGEGPQVPARGRWTIAVELPEDGSSAQHLRGLRSGQIIRATGRVHPPRGAQHPGERDPHDLRRSAGRVATLAVPSTDLIERAQTGGLPRWLLRLRSNVSDHAHAALVRGLGNPSTDAPAALCTALLLGRYEAGGEETMNAMRRIGLAHLLAISGLHVGLITGGAVLLARGLIRPTRWDGVIILAVLALYLLLVEWRVPVLRAAVMGAAIAVGLVAARRWRARGLLSLSAIVLLLHRPEQITTAGFQLSFGVVLALVQFAQPFAARLHPINRPARHSLRGWISSAFAASTVAWLTAMPIAAWHFGVISPLAIPLAIVGLPVIAIMLVLGFLKMATGAVARAAGDPLTGAADALVALLLRGTARAAADASHWLDALPLSSIPCHPPHGLLVAALILWTMFRLSGRLRIGPTRTRFVDLLLIILLLTPVHGRMPALRIDTIAVGDGTCHVLRSGGRTMLFDAGSASLPGAGRRTIIPALHALGVRSIDLLVISHPDLDHFSAVPEILDAVPVRRVLLSHDFCRRARDKGLSSAQLLSELERRHLAIELVDDTWSRTFGDIRLHVLHPAADDHLISDNDASVVLLAQCLRGPPGGAALLTGDIEGTAIERLLTRTPDLRADILELPHHGSAQPGTATLIAAVRPRVILQSTGPRRLRRDPWSDLLPPAIVRAVTARDGSISTELHTDGRIIVRRHGRTEPRPLAHRFPTMAP